MRAFALIADELRALDSPDAAAFYTSGRTSNEAAFLYQLLIRCFGHEQFARLFEHVPRIVGYGAAQRRIGIGKGTVVGRLTSTDADLILIVAGQNPGTNHPRMLSALEKAKANGRDGNRGEPAAGGRRCCGSRIRRRCDGVIGGGDATRRRVPADPHRRRSGAVPGGWKAAARGGGRATPAPCWTGRSSPSTATGFDAYAERRPGG